MEDCLICPFCHNIVLPVEFDGGWKCECVRCEYTSREGDTKDEAIEMHMELQAKEADASVLRALIKEMIPWLASVGEEVVSGKPQEDVRALVARAMEVVK